jgi:glycosyltransferase involved in cell wall biosynthesis
MEILYFYRVPLPDPRADAVQIVNTCAGMARAGAAVTLHVETMRTGSVTECLSFYGIEDPAAGGAGSLDILALGTHWSWPWLAWKTRATFAAARPPACLFVREVRPYVPSLIARAKARGLKVIFEAHNVSASLVEEKEEKARATAGAAVARLRARAAKRAQLERRILAVIDGLVCTQAATLKGLQPLLRPGLPAIVLGNGTRLPPAAAARPGAARDIDVLYCGSLKPWKGVDGLVAALAHLPEVKLTIVGPAPPSDVDRLVALARGLGVSERITILPAVPPAQVWGFYARARVGVIPLPGANYVEARDFTSPLKLFEMMAAGLPVVASRLPSLADYVTDGAEGLLVAPDDPAALADSIRRVLGDAALRAAMADAGRRRAAGFTWDARGARIVAFAGSLLGAAGSVR